MSGTGGGIFGAGGRGCGKNSDRCDYVLSSCVGVLVENKRLGHLAKMTADYAKLIAADRDELVATVTTAVVRAEFLLLPAVP